VNTHQQSGCWYIDVRPNESSEQISLDLTQHIPRRLAVGKSLVITAEPRKLVPVIRKRWVALLGLVERQYASTLDHFKKQGLRWEIDRMRAATFSRRLPLQDPQAAVFFLESQLLGDRLTNFKTIYVTCPLTKQEFAAAVNHLLPGGLVVIYGQWCTDFEIVMHDLVRSYTEDRSMPGSAPD